MCTKKIRQSHSEFHPQDAMTWKHKGDFTANNVQSDTDIIWWNKICCVNYTKQFINGKTKKEADA